MWRFPGVGEISGDQGAQQDLRQEEAAAARMYKLCCPSEFLVHKN
jgi:hypothetical protein